MAEVKCPKCKKEIGSVNFYCDYTEYGSAYGKADFNGDEETDGNDSSGYDTDNTKYECPECHKDLEYEDLENMEAIEDDVELPHPDQEGYEYYTGKDKEKIKVTEATTEQGIVIEQNEGHEVFVYKCPNCKTETPTEIIKKSYISDEETTYEDAICICGKELTKENSKIINY